MSIIDLAGGAQPLAGERDGTIAIVNGEIYNYVELRQELAASGAQLRTRSDSEVIPFLYDRHGVDFVHRLRGAFAAAIWDASRQQLLLVRDRVGEKPLLHATGSDGTVYFASEIGALVASGMIPVEPDMEAINRYYHFRFFPEPATPLRHVRKLRAGHVMALSPEHPVPAPRQYWNVSAIAPMQGDPVEILRADLEEVGRIIVRSDVPIGVALSGGLDSSIVASLAARHSVGAVTAFSVGYSGRPTCDERGDASAFARHLGIDMVEVELSVGDVVSGFEGLVADMGEPIADATGSSYRAVMQAANRAGIKVMFQGQGADELFWSYGWMREALAENLLRDSGAGDLALFADSVREKLRAPPAGSPREFAQWCVQAGGLVDALSRFRRLRQDDPGQPLFWDVARPMDRIAQAVSALAGESLRPHATLRQARGAFHGREQGESWRRALVRHIFATYLLDNGISQADRYSMATGVEARLPFVDYRLVEHAVGLNETRPEAVSPGKRWLRAAVAGDIPEWVLNRPKRGFTPPTREWVGALVRARGELLADGVLVSIGVLSTRGAQALTRPSGPFDRGLRDQLAYQSLVLEQWFGGMRALAVTAGGVAHTGHVLTPPKILIHYSVLSTGGAERSMLRLIAGLADRGCEVHLVLTAAGGRLEPEIDPRVIVHHLRDWMGNIPVKMTGIRDASRYVFGATRWAWGRLQQAWRSRRFAGMRFDAAYVGVTGLSPAFICNVVEARKRFVFVRSDPLADHHGRWAANIHKFHERIDAYVCVSDHVRKAMAARFPEIGDKCVTGYNLLDAPAMRARAGERPDPFPDDHDLVRVLSVCRLQEASKALLRMVEVHRRLLDAGVAHIWHVLGDGSDRVLLEHAIEKHGVSASFRLHGAIDNPFPYYRHADICAVLSRYEGLCGVVNEARVLERPVIATRFAGIEEQIEDGVNGLIVEQDVAAICDGLAKLIRDAGLRERLAQGDYPRDLLDDGAKVDRLMSMFGEPGTGSSTVFR